MTGNEAIHMLKAAGFHRIRIDSGGHEHWQLGKHRIMVSTGSADLDPTVAFRIKKLCQGSLGARDMQREAHQGKRELPNTIFKIGDPVENIATERKGVIVDIDYQRDRAGVDWGSGGEDKDVELEVLFSRLRLSRRPIIQTLTGESQEPQVQEQQERKEETVESQSDRSGVTLMEQLAYIGMAAEDEYNRLVEFKEAVLIYEHIFDLQEQLGIEVRPLPFKLVDGAKTVRVEVGVEVGSEEQAAPTVVTRSRLSQRRRRANKPINESTIEALLQENQGIMHRSAIINHFSWSRKDQVLEILDQMMGLGLIEVVQESSVGRGSWLCTLTSAADRAK